MYTGEQPQRPDRAELAAVEKVVVRSDQDVSQDEGDDDEEDELDYCGFDAKEGETIENEVTLFRDQADDGDDDAPLFEKPVEELIDSK